MSERDVIDWNDFQVQAEVRSVMESVVDDVTSARKPEVKIIKNGYLKVLCRGIERAYNWSDTEFRIILRRRNRAVSQPYSETFPSTAIFDKFRAQRFGRCMLVDGNYLTRRDLKHVIRRPTTWQLISNDNHNQDVKIPTANENNTLLSPSVAIHPSLIILRTRAYRPVNYPSDGCIIITISIDLLARPVCYVLRTRS